MLHILYDGYSYQSDGKMMANCTCTLITGDKNIIVDCMTAWDKAKIIEGLASHQLTPSMIDYCIGTHGHSDHVGNLNLFTDAVHIVGFTISKENEFIDHPFSKGISYDITDQIKVVPTPGHTSEDVSVYVRDRSHDPTVSEKVQYVIAGDIFEREEDIKTNNLWIENSSFPDLQRESRRKVIKDADFVIPGHGPMFKVTQDIKNEFL